MEHFLDSVGTMSTKTDSCSVVPNSWYHPNPHPCKSIVATTVAHIIVGISRMTMDKHLKSPCLLELERIATDLSSAGHHLQEALMDCSQFHPTGLVADWPTVDLTFIQVAILEGHHRLTCKIAMASSVN